MSVTRRLAALFLALFTLSVLSAGSAAAWAADGPEGHEGQQGQGRHDRPFRFGPFEFPESGNVSGGFAWDLEN
ncbi:hypothetical protein [Streptomyces abyssomicinicus]|uniref:hypothetical protein n=1 Tax=Streptomyces abyssomicinicus TaxID=574929 RepID=UPI00125041FA|nr:hypothetical protein [Streptomyces abyssomicinicus]